MIRRGVGKITVEVWTRKMEYYEISELFPKKDEYYEISE
jgi:hypothetical protein